MPHDVLRVRDKHFGTHLWGPAPQNWEGKNVQNSAQFWITFDFDCEYLRNGRDVKNQVQPSNFGQKN